MNSVYILIYCALYALLNIAGVTCIKINLEGKKLGSFTDYFQLLMKPGVILGFGVIFLSALVMFKALSIGKFSIVGPLSTGINFVLTVFIGVLFFNDKLGLNAYIGLLLIIAGITLCSIKS